MSVGTGTFSRRFRSVAAIIILLALGCAKSMPPPGGPVDETAPSIQSTAPATGAVNVPPSTSISLIFSEGIDRTTVSNSLFISPQPEKEPKIKISGDAITIVPREPLRPDKTYVITLGTDLKDAHGVNLAHSATIAFSTGSAVDSGSLSGTVYKEDEEAAGISLALFEADPASKDGPIDSLKPVYLTQSGKGGTFSFDYLPADTFYIVAFEDKNKNRYVNPAREMVGLPFRFASISPESPVLSGIDIRLHLFDTTMLELRSVMMNPDGLLKIRFNKALQLAEWHTLVMSRRLTAENQDSSIEISGSASLARFPTADFLLLAGGLKAGAKYQLIFDRATLDPELSDSTRYITYGFDAREIMDRTPPALLETTPDDNAVNIYPESLFVWRFSEPVDTARLADAFRVVNQQAETTSVDIYPRDLFSCEGKPAAALDYGNTYKMAIDGRVIIDRAGNRMADSIIWRPFTTIGRDTLGNLSGEVHFTDMTDAGSPVVISLNPVGSGTAKTFSLDPGSTSFLISLLPGNYTVAAFLDRDSDSRFDFGSFSPYRLAEPFVFPVDTFRVRSRFESTGLVVEF